VPRPGVRSPRGAQLLGTSDRRGRTGTLNSNSGGIGGFGGLGFPLPALVFASFVKQNTFSPKSFDPGPGRANRAKASSALHPAGSEPWTRCIVQHRTEHHAKCLCTNRLGPRSWFSPTVTSPQRARVVERGTGGEARAPRPWTFRALSAASRSFLSADGARGPPGWSRGAVGLPCPPSIWSGGGKSDGSPSGPDTPRVLPNLGATNPAWSLPVTCEIRP
jgi:hypothetical protein